MATKARKRSTKKRTAAAKRGAATKRRAAKKRSAASMRGAATKRSATRKRSAASKRGAVKRRSPTRSKKQSPVARVKRVTREVVQQAQVAVSAGVERLQDLGGNLVDRVRST